LKSHIAQQTIARDCFPLGQISGADGQAADTFASGSENDVYDSGCGVGDRDKELEAMHAATLWS